MSEVRTLGELVARGSLALSDGYRTRADQLGPEGIPILRVADVLDGRVDPSFKDHIRDEYRPKMGAKISRFGDVLITTKGTVGRVARVPRGFPEHSYSPQVCFLRALDIEEIDPTWLYYWACSTELLEQIGIYKDQTDMAPYVSLTDLRRVTITLPAIKDQRRVAAALQALDDLIETNRVAMANLRSIALTTLDAQSRSGNVVPFGEIATQIRDGAPSGSWAPGTPYLGLEHFGTDGVGLTGVGDASTVDSTKSRFRAGDVLYGKLRPYFRKVDRPDFNGVCSTEIWVLRPKPSWGAATLNAVVARSEFTEFAMAGNTGTRMPRANWAHVVTMPVPVPPKRERDLLDQQLDDLWRVGVALADEIADLTRTRDVLLPLLMSGQVRVADVEAA